MSKKKISIISSAYNEETNIPLLYAQVKEQMQKLSAKYDYEQLVLDNASQAGGTPATDSKVGRRL